MKTLSINILVVALLSVTIISFGQTKNGYVRRNGKMFEVLDGKVRPLANDVMLSNGVSVFRNGTVIQKNGVRQNVNENEGVDVLGQILYPQTGQDGEVILNPRRDDQYEERRRSDGRYDGDDDRYENKRRGDDDWDKEEKNKYKKNKKGKNGPPYGNAYGHYKNKNKRNK